MCACVQCVCVDMCGHVFRGVRECVHVCVCAVCVHAYVCRCMHEWACVCMSGHACACEWTCVCV